MSSRKNRSPEKQASRAKSREFPQKATSAAWRTSRISLKETIAEFMENGLDAELDDELGYSKYDCKHKETENSRNGHSGKTRRTSFTSCHSPELLLGTFALQQAENKP